MLMVKGWRFVMRNMDIVSINIMSIVVKVMCSIVSMVKFLVLPLIVNLVD